ncbi:hypothetical protein BGZ67_009552 [Mortierella alpina]|nr:hypothetical protein BGZ67_009552 [Mortierella alpina]
MIWIIIARGIAGIGAGGILSMVMIIIADLVSLRERGKYQGAIGATFGMSSIIGPLLGGVFTDKATWRWAFFINLPIGAITVVMVILLLHLPQIKSSFKDKVRRIDFLGSLSLICGLVLILLPLNWGGSAYAWDSPIIISLFCVGFLVLAAFCIVEWKQAAEPIIPFDIFKNRTSSAVFLTSFFIGMGYYGIMYFMPLYYQIVRQESATSAGLEMLSLLVSMVIASIGSGLMVSQWGHFRPFIWVGLILATIGIGLLRLLRVGSSRSQEVCSLVVAGFGLGLVMQTIVLAVQSSVDTKDVAVATAITTFFRTVGSAFGVAITGAVFHNAVQDNFAPLIRSNPDVAKVIQNSYLAPTFGPELEHFILCAFMQALRKAFTVCTPFIGLAFLSSLFIQHHKLRKVRSPSPRE